MREETKRAAELWLCAQLTKATGIVFTANKGGADPGGTSEPMPDPQGVVQVTECVNALHGTPLYQITAIIGYMSNMGDANAQEHSDAVRKVEDAIYALPQKSYYAPLDLTVHGTDLKDAESFSDDNNTVRGDAFTITMGVSH